MTVHVTCWLYRINVESKLEQAALHWILVEKQLGKVKDCALAIALETLVLLTPRTKSTTVTTTPLFALLSTYWHYLWKVLHARRRQTCKVRRFAGSPSHVMPPKPNVAVMILLTYLCRRGMRSLLGQMYDTATNKGLSSLLQQILLDKHTTKEGNAWLISSSSLSLHMAHVHAQN